MAEQVRTKKEVQREQTHQRLLESAESLFAEQGIAAVSLRQIGEHAGSLNTNVVGYYFGSKEALIEAIYRHRIPRIEHWRAGFLGDADRRGVGMELSTLLKAIWLPWYEQRNEDGRHSYGRFMLNLEREGLGWMRISLDPEFPVSLDAHNRIKRYFEIHRIPNPDFRFAMQINMILETLDYIDNRKLTIAESRVVFDDALTMAQAALLSGSRLDG